MSDHRQVKGAEFLRKIRILAKARKMPVRLVAARGKGSHSTLYLGTRFTTIKDQKKEIGPGLLKTMLRDLGLKKKDLL